eukprot:3102475-Prymnesium_polylepis.1
MPIHALESFLSTLCPDRKALFRAFGMDDTSWMESIRHGEGRSRPGLRVLRETVFSTKLKYAHG